MNPLPDAITAVVETLSDSHVLALSNACGTAKSYGRRAARKAKDALPVTHHARIEPVLAAWSQSPDTPGAALALSLETALVARRAAASTTLELVVTGPDSPAAPVRLTSQVVRQLIDAATRRITLVSYAAYSMPEVIQALDAAQLRGVQVDVILESASKLAGGGGGAAYAKYGIYEWPVAHRNSPHASLHAKAVIVDSRDALLTSANMTQAAYDQNIELGVLCRGGQIAGRAQRHFDALIATGVLVKVTP